MLGREKKSAPGTAAIPANTAYFLRWERRRLAGQRLVIAISA
jgi:hypothetical protein